MTGRMVWFAVIDSSGDIRVITESLPTHPTLHPLPPLATHMEVTDSMGSSAVVVHPMHATNGDNDVNGMNGTEGLTASPMTTSAPMNTSDTPMDTMETQLETQTVTQMVSEMVGQSVSHWCEPKSRYQRKTCTEMAVKLWRVLQTINGFHKSRQELHQNVSNQMLEEFNVKLNDNRINQLIETAIDDKLITAEETDDSQIRYVANFDRQLFGEVSTDWLCFECHLAVEDRVLIGCTTCFRAFHPQCLKVKVNPNSYECGYCERLVQRDTTLKVTVMAVKGCNGCCE
ncbi:unnamed protein product [Oppiella nova]|uniref:Uncharacterized protein n=1 Tax=Oppiella nova TaxID=334625 RepID=A0A7R9LCN6_9ACAR|nr:unnamed protein product [Oppiella nova]CAG2162271.1 unnamed protein product [Oppiella nova]